MASTRFGFLTQVEQGSLVFNYLAGGSGNYYFVPAGMEDSLFGNGVVLQVDISWNKAGVNLYLNNTLVNSVPYTMLSPNWTAASNFDLGAYEYLTFGGYNASDDAIGSFTVTAPASVGRASRSPWRRPLPVRQFRESRRFRRTHLPP